MSASVAEQALPYLKPTSNGWLRGPCPYCEAGGHRDRKASFGVSPSGVYGCFRCGCKGRIDLPDDLPRAVVLGGTAVDTGPPEGFEPVYEEGSWSAECYAPARAYLAGRGVDRAMAAEAGIGAVLTGRYHHRVVVPVRDGGRWVGWVGRAWGPSDRPYIYPSGAWRAAALYNRAALSVETDVPVMVVEGVFDSLSVWPDAVAVLGKPSVVQVDLLASARRPVAVVLDGDAHVEGWALGQLLRFRGCRAGSVRLPPGADPDEVDRGWLYEEARRCVDAA